MFARRRLGLDPGLERREARAGWIAWARAAAVPFVLLEVALERGNYPSGDERLAWALAAGFAVAAGLLLLLRGRAWAAPAGLALDALFVSAFVVLYSFEAGTTVRQLLVLPVVEGALLYGLHGGLLLPLASLPALAFFEWRQAERLDLHPFDGGHVLGPVGIQLLVGVAVGALVARLEQRRN
ncbi:MAG TPA: hypothetical protein VNO56_09495 [Gaiellaceae bacterium]|nr:hypothetical protein [Gaiellaceae bacterium]